MKKANDTNALTAAIAALEKKQALELELIKEQLHNTYNHLKPLSLIKSAVDDVRATPNLTSNIFNNIIGLGTGYLLKRVVIGKSAGPVKKWMGLLLQLAITKIVAKKAATVHTSKA